MTDFDRMLALRVPRETPEMAAEQELRKIANATAVPELRDMRHDDVSQIVEIEGRSFTKEAYPRHVFEDWLRFGLTGRVVALGEKVAAYALERDDDRTPGFTLNQSIAVAPEFRRRGLGETLVRDMMARHEKVSADVETSNRASKKMFKKLGFVTVRTFKEEGRRAHRMHLDQHTKKADSEHDAEIEAEIEKIRKEKRYYGRYKCPHCGGTNLLNGIPGTGTTFRGSGHCQDCDKGCSIVGSKLERLGDGPEIGFTEDQADQYRRSQKLMKRLKAREKEAKSTIEEPADTRPYRDRAEVYAMKDGKLFGSLYNHGGFGVYGGGIDPGEDGATAATRELGEEAGWTVKNVKPLPFDPHVLDWAPPDENTSEKHRERYKQFRGSRTYYYVGDLDKQIPKAKLDNADRKESGLYDLDDAISLSDQPDLETDLQAANASRVKVLKHLQSTYAPKMVAVKRAADSDHPFTICVDLDGTLAKKEEPFDPDSIGAPIAKTVRWVRRFRKSGARIIIFTVRGDKDLVTDWLDEHEVPYDFVNENPDQPPNSSGKVFADVYWDDRAFNAENPDEHGPEILRRVKAHGGDEDGNEGGMTVTVSRQTVVTITAPFLLESLGGEYGEAEEERTGKSD